MKISTVKLIALLLLIPSIAFSQNYVQMNRVDLRVWNPTSGAVNKWTNGNATGYAEGQTVVHSVRFTQNTTDSKRIDLCLEAFITEPVLQFKYPFISFNQWDDTYAPTVTPDGTTIAINTTSGVISAMNANITSVSTASVANNLCAINELGIQVIFNKIVGNQDAYLFYGGVLGAPGDSLPNGLIINNIPNNRGAASVNANFQTRIRGFQSIFPSTESVDLSQVTVTPGISLTKTVTTADGTCGVDDTNSISVASGTEIKFCFVISNTGQAPLYNVALVDDTLQVDLTDDLTGRTDQDDDSDADDLGVGQIARAEYLYIVSGEIENTATAIGSATESQDTSTVDVYSCGDGEVNPGETCDDGNNTPNDGCSATCQSEYCGNGAVEGNEECDDSNDVDGDGCSASCLSEVCGNGRVDYAEECDDSNTDDGDGCSATCLSEICGNGRVDFEEECDDGNEENGDGCNAYCEIEVCGNEVIDFGEECDDGNGAGGDGCSADCEVEVCGNGRIDYYDQCDDGNTENGDGCSSTCQHEFCGNGIVDFGEECDDGYEQEECEGPCFKQDTLILENELGKEGDQICSLECKILTADCNGVFGGEAKNDRCGVCEGDGNSCLNCTETNITSNQFDLDGSAEQLFSLVKRVNKLILRKGGKTKNNKTFTAKLENEGSFEYNGSWTATWSVQSNIQQCGSLFCVNISHVETFNTIDLHAANLHNLVKKAVKRLRRITGNKKSGKKHLNKAQSLYDAIQAELDGLPKTTSSC